MLDKIPWEDVCYGVIAEGNGRQAPAKIAAPFTSVARLREIEPGIVTLLEKLGATSYFDYFEGDDAAGAEVLARSFAQESMFAGGPAFWGMMRPPAEVDA